MTPKETLEEAALNYSTDMLGTIYEELEKAFAKGAKWQQKRNYSEEEVLVLLHKSCDYIYASAKIGTDKKLMPNLLIGWFEQFKKK